MRFTALLVCLLAGTAIAAPRAGQKTYASRCGSCHDGKLAFKVTGFGCAKCHGVRK